MNRWMIAAIMALILVTAVLVSADAKGVVGMRERALSQCEGKFKDKRPTPKELKKILNDHNVWFKSFRGKWKTLVAQSDPRMANLCGADLMGTNLSGNTLPVGNLSGADLSGADFSRTFLWNANLSGVNLYNTNLSRAVLWGANLSGASLIGTTLSGASLKVANLSRAVFEPEDLPYPDDIASAKNLSEMVFYNNPQPLIELREAFKEGGFRQQEREITCAYQRETTRRNFNKGGVASVEAVIRYGLFDFTCHWGMVPNRALLILFALIPIFAIPYTFRLCIRGKDGIWCKWADDRLRVDLGTKKATLIYVRWHRWLRAPALGFYFSVLSAFNIGWREFTVGNWIQRVQRKEFTLRASGWMRTISGGQSLISAYLLAIWALTYFGRLFE